VRLAPDWYYPCIQLGELFLRMNNTEAAAEWFTRAYQIAPNEPEVLQILADPDIQGILDNQQLLQ
ncbi:MAG TPA: hypothetical protein PLP86_02250, partial [Armatimonadota bacterium]|nr:hypothetical protein [Armatimonadota bacterium]